MSSSELGFLLGRVAASDAIDNLLGRSVKALAVPEPARAIAISALAQAADRRPVLVIAPRSSDCTRLANDIAAYLGENEVSVFPGWETLPFERISPSVEVMGTRLETLWRLQDQKRYPRVVVSSIRAAVQRLSPGLGSIEPMVISVADEVDQVELVAELVASGYRREAQVQQRGEIAVRGSIIDVFPSTSDVAYRIDLWGDRVERLCEFSVATQRSTQDCERLEIFACRELILNDQQRAMALGLQKTEPWGAQHWQRLANGELFDGMESWLPWLSDQELLLTDFIDSDGLVVMVEPGQIKRRGTDLLSEEADLANSLAKTWGVNQSSSEDTSEAELEPFPRLHLPLDYLMARTTAHAVSLMALPEGPEVAMLAASGWELPGEKLQARLVKLEADGATVLIAADSAGSARRLNEIVQQWGLTPRRLKDPVDLSSSGIFVAEVALERGFVLSEANVAVLTAADLTGRRRVHRRVKRSARQSSGFIDDLRPGNYVVHHRHGVGRYGGLVSRAIGGHERDYLLIEYRGDDKLYLPTDQIELIRKFTTGDNPNLNKLGGADFARTKAKVQSAVTEIAQELVLLYQQRVTTEGHAFDPDTPWQVEVEEAFPYELTPDQASAIAEIKQDMERPVPMDRLVVGDVGFGKTELAVRAVFKAVQGAKQAAVLVPTTLLAQQHFQTFSQRFAPYPLRVEVLSRFLTQAQARKVVEGLQSGEVDVVIGTHRLLSEDISFHDLGLLVVDEEQRFGVSHKESLKGLRSIDKGSGLSVSVDVLTLSATPIPRTLEMSLTGIRDMSVLNTPPADRQPVMTYVGEYDERAAAEAVRRELIREGQVFFVHNRVQTIEKAANDLQNLVPEARIAIAHGQMDEAALEKTVLDFWEGMYDVLVCTTIIESGIDMPTVNTLVVDRAERLGLGQLHQLRGRVGRSGQRAYAYLFTAPDVGLSGDMYERLRTIGEATELGSGFQIAMRDLEIRGAGNLLGTGQSGHIASVGYDLYVQMVSEAVAALSGETAEKPLEIKIDLPDSANLPTDYIAAQGQRIEAYRKLAEVESDAEVDTICSEWEDRYGRLPDPAVRLLSIARLRVRCALIGLEELLVLKGSGFGGPDFIVKFGPVKLLASQEVRFKRLFPDGVWKPSEYGPQGGQLQLGLKKSKSVRAKTASRPGFDIALELVAVLETLFELRECVAQSPPRLGHAVLPGET